MSYPYEVVKVTLSGDMFSGAEIWSTGFHMGFENADASPIMPAGLAQLGAAFQTFFTAAGSSVSNRFTFKQVKMARVAQNGATIPDSAQYWNPTGTVTGAATSGHLPPQIALAVTLANSLPRGLATKGRMFLPGICTPVDATGHILTSEAGAIATNLKTFFDGIYNDADLPGNPVLASLGRGPLLQDGAIRNIVKIRVGNVYDTQRRRRNALVEAYTDRSVAGG